MKYKKLLSIMLLCTVLLSGCGIKDNSSESTKSEATSEITKESDNDDSKDNTSESSDTEDNSEENADDSGYNNKDVVVSGNVLSDFDCETNKDYILSTACKDDSILKFAIKLNHDVDFKVVKDLTTMTDHIIFDDENYSVDVDDTGNTDILTYDDLLKNYDIEVNDDTLEKYKVSSDNVYYDIIVVDGYSSVCSDKDISKYYNTNGGVHEKSKNEVSYTTNFKIGSHEIKVDYKYGYDNGRCCLDIVATYPNDYDGLRILGLGQDRSSCAGYYAIIGDEDMKPYIDKKDLSKIFKVWGTDNDNDMMELSTYADFIFNKEDLSFDMTGLIDNQYFFGGSLALGFDSDTFIHDKESKTYRIPVEQTWGNMLNTSTITVFNPLLEK